MSRFQWTIALLDDEPASADVAKAVRQLEEVGLRIVKASNADEFLAHADALAGCHLGLVDVKWLTFDTQDGLWDQAQVDLADERQMVSSDAWVRAIAYWFKESKRQITSHVSPNDERWPKAPIFDVQVGIWLGACLSHLNYAVKVILWSGSSQISLAGDFAALGAFKGAAFRVVNKDPQGPLARLEVWRVLEDLQRQALRRNDLHEWFLSHVLIPLVLDLEPLVKRAVPAFSDDADGKVDLHPESFFPQLQSEAHLTVFFAEGKENKQWRRQYLARFLRDRGERLEHWQRVYLQGARHILKNIPGDADRAVVARETARARDTCVYAGYVGDTVADRLEGIEREAVSGNDAGSDLRRGLDETLALLEDLFEPGEESLERLCREFGGQMSYECGIDADRLGARLPFGLLDARAAAVVLRDNALAQGCRSDGAVLAAKIIEVAEGEAEELQLEWTDQSKGFSSYSEFCTAVHRSISMKGSSRGLALPVLLGIRHRALETEVFIKGAGAWTMLGEPHRTAAETRTLGFGLRWRFSYADAFSIRGPQ